MHIQPKVNNARRGVGGHNCPEQDDTESGSERKKEVHDTRTHTYNVGGWVESEGYTMIIIIIIICIVVYYIYVCLATSQPCSQRWWRSSSTKTWRSGGEPLIPLISWSIERRRRLFSLIVHQIYNIIRGCYALAVSAHRLYIHTYNQVKVSK